MTDESSSELYQEQLGYIKIESNFFPNSIQDPDPTKWIRSLEPNLFSELDTYLLQVRLAHDSHDFIFRTFTKIVKDRITPHSSP